MEHQTTTSPVIPTWAENILTCLSTKNYTSRIPCLFFHFLAPLLTSEMTGSVMDTGEACTCKRSPSLFLSLLFYVLSRLLHVFLSSFLYSLDSGIFSLFSLHPLLSVRNVINTGHDQYDPPRLRGISFPRMLPNSRLPPTSKSPLLRTSSRWPISD